jgi:hypothetical protein
MIPRLHPTTFDWSRWRAACIADLGVPCREQTIIANAYILRRYAIGWLEGERLMCRPEKGEVAVLFLKDGQEFWFHLRDKEFRAVFER